ncbi:MAG: hypothetical protein UIM27_03570 [Acutalibacteraceae bacterium]|nr:hypothetical protein [Acutalibacteraceae bacterium]
MVRDAVKGNSESSKKSFLRNCYISYLKDQDKERAAGNFEALYNFYRAVYVSNNYQSKIMITRRSYVLFKIMEKALEDENYKKNGNFYTSNFISQISNTNDTDSKTILIMDDIVINGRTMEKAHDKLKKLLMAKNKENYKNIDIKLHAFLINKGAKCLKNIEKYFINDEVKVSEACWRSVSDELNLFIAVTNIGYTSYVDTVNIRFKDIDKISELINGDPCYTRQLNTMFNKINLNSYIKELTAVDFQGFPEFYKLLKRLGIVPFLRLYFRTEMIPGSNDNEDASLNNNAAVIPFAYLPSIKKSEFVAYSDVILSFLKKYTQISETTLLNIKNIVDSIDYKPDEEYIYLYEWFTFIISKLIETVLKRSCVLFDKDETDEPVSGIACTETFNETYVKSIDFNGESSAFEHEYFYKAPKRWDVEQSCEKECVSKLDEVKDKQKDDKDNTSIDQNLRKALPEYLSEVRKIDELRAQSIEERLKGLRADDVYYIYKTELPMEAIMKVFINSWDCGDGSGAPRIFEYNNEKIISTSIINGEQIYRFIFDEYPLESYDFRLFYFNSIRHGYTDLKKFAEYMDKESDGSHHKNFLDYFQVSDGDSAPQDLVAGISSAYAVNKSDPNLKKNFEKIMKYIGLF